MCHVESSRVSAAPVGALDICLHILQAVDVTQSFHRALSAAGSPDEVTHEGRDEFLGVFAAIQQVKCCCSAYLVVVGLLHVVHCVD